MVHRFLIFRDCTPETALEHSRARSARSGPVKPARRSGPHSCGRPASARPRRSLRVGSYSPSFVMGIGICVLSGVLLVAGLASAGKLPAAGGASASPDPA